MRKRVMCGVVLVICSGVIAAPRANITIRVVDEAGTPIQGASTSIHFEMYPDRVKSFEGLTDTNGLFSAQEETDINVTEIAEKDGYYKSSETHFFKALSADQTRYEPWDEIRTLVLRKIIEPKEGLLGSTRIGAASWLEIPAYEQDVGLDVLESDWVAPYGKGKTADFVFTFSKDTEQKTLSYVLTFSNTGDGIMEYSFNRGNRSLFKWPHKAPLDGYASTLERMTGYDRSRAVIPAEKKMREVHYMFRVRTKFDNEGNIKSALYGKIAGEIELSAKPKDELRFGYWLNTDPISRSLESTNPYSP
jgi:hypothetical protein